jgi:hypothetical protein
MTPNFYKAALLCLFSLISCMAFSQNIPKTDTIANKPDTNKNKTPKKASFKIGVDYVTNNVFMGRTDTISTPIISTNLKFTFKSGIYLSGSLNYLPTRKKSKLDGVDIALGYDFDLIENLSGSVSFTKLFFAKTSTQVSSAISSTISGNLDYNIADIITTSIGLDYSLNKQGVSNDVSFNFGLSHDFITEGIFGDKDILLISPIAALNSGTQNFYNGYLVRKNLKNAKRNAAEAKLFNSYTTELSQFQLLDFEFSLPIEYKTGKFIFHITPTYALAENQFQSLAIQKLLGLSSQSTVFYFEAGVALKF